MWLTCPWRLAQTGKSPIYEADNALLTRERKLHNAYGILPFSPEDPSAYTIHAQVICPSLIGGGVIGECSVDLAAVTPGKVRPIYIFFE